MEDPSKDIWAGLDDADFLNIDIEKENVDITGNEDVKEIDSPNRCKRQKFIQTEGTLGTRSTICSKDLENGSAHSQVTEGKKSEEQQNSAEAQGNESQLATTSALACQGTAGEKENVVPLRDLRNGYLWVSDFSAQSWCEQKHEYKISSPTVVPEPEHITTGTTLHLMRELEVQDYKQIKVTTDEDSFAIKVINLIMVLRKLQCSEVVQREVPIFGVYKGIIILGKIDEIRLDPSAFTIDVVELKSRISKKAPGRAQQRTHDMQVMIYKFLFDDLIRGHIPRYNLAKTLGLNLKKSLGICILAFIKDNQIVFSEENYSREDWNLGVLLDEVKSVAASLPFVHSCYVDYVWQQDLQSFLLHEVVQRLLQQVGKALILPIREVKYDNQWLFKKMDSCLEYWLGQRSAQGVDVEEAWKCHNCEYLKECSWVAAKICERKNYVAQKQAPYS